MAAGVASLVARSKRSRVEEAVVPRTVAPSGTVLLEAVLNSRTDRAGSADAMSTSRAPPVVLVAAPDWTRCSPFEKHAAVLEVLAAPLVRAVDDLRHAHDREQHEAAEQRHGAGLPGVRHAAPSACG